MRFITRIIIVVWFPSILVADTNPGNELSISEAVSYALSVHPGAEIATSLVSEAKGARLSEISPSSPVIAVEFDGVPDGANVKDYEERRISISQELAFPLHILWNTSASNRNIELADFINPTGLEAIGDNLFRESAASGSPSTATPGQDGLGTLIQGSLESSNVNVVEELVNMIETQRAYEMNSKAISTTDEMLAYVSNQL